MPALNFQTQFVGLIESGEKRQTIRSLRKDGRNPGPGQTLYLYTGMRTKKCRKLGEATCTSCSFILIDRDAELHVNNQPLQPHEYDAFAKADGFSDFEEMFQWFKTTHGLPFDGMLICW